MIAWVTDGGGVRGASSRARFPDHEVLELDVAPRGALCELRRWSTCGREPPTTRATFPAPRISTRSSTSRRSGPTPQSAAATRCPTSSSSRRSSRASASGPTTFVLAARRRHGLGRALLVAPAPPRSRRGRDVRPPRLRRPARRRDAVATRARRLPGAAARRRHDHRRGDPRAARRPVARCSSTPAAATRWLGDEEPLDPVAGRIPGARQRALRPSRCPTGRPRRRELVAYCGSGVTACVVAQKLVLAGRDDVRLYPGSFSEWCRRESYPIEKGTP